jgi:hypothetical protein
VLSLFAAFFDSTEDTNCARTVRVCKARFNPEGILAGCPAYVTLARPQPPQESVRILATPEHFQQRRADHHTIDVAAQPLDLRPAADAEARADRQRRDGAHAVEVLAGLAAQGQSVRIALRLVDRFRLF